MWFHLGTFNDSGIRAGEDSEGLRQLSLPSAEILAVDPWLRQYPARRSGLLAITKLGDPVLDQPNCGVLLLVHRFHYDEALSVG